MIIQANELKAARKRKGWSREDLARESKLSVRQIARLESDREGHRRVRGHTVRQLSEALNIQESALAGELPRLSPEAGRDSPPKGQVSLTIDTACRNAMALVARRYSVTQQQIVEVAPLLFLIMAEQSLARRRDQIEQLRDVIFQSESAVPRHLNQIWRFSDEDNERAIAAEERSVEERDLFGKRLGGRCEASDAENPFARYLSESLMNCDPLTTTNYIPVRWEAGEEPNYRIGLDELAEMLGDDHVAWEPVLNGKVALAQMPGEIRKAKPADRAEWVKEKVRAQEKELTEFLKTFDPDDVSWK